MLQDQILCLDIGGSSVKSAIFSVTYYASERSLFKPLPEVEIASRDFISLKSAVLEAVEQGLHEASSTMIGISTTGAVNTSGIVFGPSPFEGYEQVDWAAILHERFPYVTHVKVVNDGKASTWAEYKYCSVRDSAHVHFVLGTGVGGSIVVNGQLIDGDSYQAGFIGHTRVTDARTVVCSCGKEGCLETVASARGLVYEYNKMTRRSVQSFSEFQVAIRHSDQQAFRVIDNACDRFGDVISAIINAVNPSYVTFGGGVILGMREALSTIGQETYFVDRIRERITTCAFELSAATTSIRYAALANDGGLIGAALLAAHKQNT